MNIQLLTHSELHGKGISVSKALHQCEGLLIDILAEVKKRKLYENYGCTNVFDYAEKFYKLSRNKTYDLLQIIQASEKVPELTMAIKQGEAEYTKIRTITPVVTKENAKELIERAKTSTTRELEQFVRKINPEIYEEKPAPKPKWISKNKMRRTLDLSAEQESFLMKAWERVNQKVGHRVSLEEAIFLLSQSFLGAEKGKPSKTMVMIHTDQDLREGYIETDKGKIFLEKETIERQMCEGEIVIQDQQKTERARHIPAKIRNHVLKRDQGRCQAPECRRVSYLIPHHMEHFAQGGEHEAGNLVTVCWWHHKGIHEGKIEVNGNPEIRDGLVWKINPEAPLSVTTWSNFSKRTEKKREAHRPEGKALPQFSGPAQLALI